MYEIPFREAAIKLYHYFKNMKVTANALGIGVATIWRWLRVSIQPKQRVYKPYKLTNAIIDYLYIIVKKQPTLTLSELSQKLQTAFNIYFSRQCIKCALKKLGFSRKKISKRGLINHDKHEALLQDFKKHFNGNVVAVDEVGFDFKVVPLYGYSKTGTKCIVNYVSKQRKRLSMIMAIDDRGNFFYQFHYTTVTASHFAEFVKILPWNNYKIILDNASIHKTKDIISAANTSTNYLLFTPPYTPECNPIENVFSVIKNHFRKRIALNPEMNYEVEITSIIKDLNTQHLFNACFRNTRQYLAI